MDGKSMATLTDEQLRILRHMLGINTPDDARPKPYRDYYCANPGDPALHELACVGAVRMYAKRGGYEWFCCTDSGRAAAISSHRTIRLRKPQRVYLRFLDCRDAFEGLTFREFLTSPEFAETRSAA